MTDARLSARPDTGTALFAGSRMGTLMQAFDWTRTPLGSVATWPQSLRTVVRLMLDSRYAMWLAWGPELTFFCNDAYRPTLGAKRDYIGAPANKVWAEIWPDIGPRIDHVLSHGEATWDEGLLLFLERRGFKEETYHTFSYSPVRDDSGLPAGMLCVVTEDTERTIGARRIATLATLSGSTLGSPDVLEAARRVVAAIAENGRDIPFAALYLLEEGTGVARRAASAGLAPGSELIASVTLPARADARPAVAADAAAEAFGRVLRRGESVAVEDYRFLGAIEPRQPWPEPIERVVISPLARAGHDKQLSGFLVTGTSPRLAFDGAYRGFLALVASQVANAISDARALEDERHRVEALAELDRAKTTFFSDVSHELRTPLTLMLSPLEEALARRTADPDDAELLNLALRNGQRLQRLVNTLLDFSRIEAGRMQTRFEPVDLAALTANLASVFRSMIEKAGVAYAIDCPPLPEPVYVDRALWEKIVFNLLSNAFKFTLQGEIRVDLRAEAGGVRLTVADTGEGIAPAAQARLFERFYRVDGARGRSIEGSGIGLALVRELARLHGGEATVESAPGAGSRFRVFVPWGHAHLPPEAIQPASAAGAPLPQAAWFEEGRSWLADATVPEPLDAHESRGVPATDRATDTAGPAPGAADAATGRRRPLVLVADDNADMRGYLRRLLEPGHVVATVADGPSALAFCRSDRPDLVVSDVMMPGLDGFALLRAVRSDVATAPTPVILLSARAGAEARLEGLEAGADDYLVKPFHARELLARVKGVLDLTRVRAEAQQRERSLDRALQESEARHRFLVRLDETLRRLDDPVAIAHASARMLSEHFKATCSYAEIDADATEATVIGQYPAEPSFPGRYVLADLGPELQAALSAGRPFLFEDAHTDARVAGGRQAFLDLGIRSHLSVPLHKGGRWTAAIGLASSRVRPWTDADVDLMRSSVIRCWEAVERAHAEIDLRTSEQHFRELADAMPQIVYVTEPDGTLAFVNRRWREVTGLDSATQADLEACIHADDLAPMRDAWARSLATAAPTQAEFRLRRPGSDAWRWYLTRWVPMLDEAGRVLRWYGASTDIDEQKRIAEALREAHEALQVSDRRKDEFLATLAHELRNPLAPLRSSAQILERTGVPEATAKARATISRQIDIMVRLVDDLLEIGRIATGKMELRREPLDLNAVMVEAIETGRPQIEAAHHRLELVSEGGPLRIQGDRTRLTQVFANVLNNAARYSDRAGVISVRVHRQDTEAIVDVVDQGIGIASDQLTRVFEIFYQGDRFRDGTQPGLGIGLSLAQRIVELHGGSITARSEGPGRGSTFTVRLPLSIQAEAGGAQALPQAAGATPAAARRLLIVDDNRDAADGLAVLAEMLGCEVRVAYDGEDALAAFAQQAADLVLLDLGMPRLDGFEVARRLRRLDGGADCLVVALSGWAQAADRQRSFEAGFDGHLAKPVDFDVFQDLLESGLRGATRSAGSTAA